MHTAFEFQAGKNAVTFDMRGDLFDAAQFGFLQFQDIKRPAMRFRVALVHPQQVTGEQGGLVPASSGTDLDHCRTCVGGIFGQQRQLQGLLGLGQLRAQIGQLFFGQRLHFGVVQHRLGLGDVVHKTPIGQHLFDHRPQV